MARSTQTSSGALAKPAKAKAPKLTKQQQMVEESVKALSEVLFESALPKITNDEELYQRFVDYFKRCIEQGRIPTVEECLLCTGYSYQYMQGVRRSIYKPPWSTDKTPEIITWAIDICRAYDAKMVMSGKLPQVPYIFRAKNHYQMSDRTEVEITTTSTDREHVSLEDLMKRYSVETTFADEPKTEPKEGN